MMESHEISKGEGGKVGQWGKTVILTLLVFGFNLVGLTFGGMEHSLQVMMVLAIAYGLIADATTNREVKWLWIALILAGLVRYENLAIVLASLGYLFYRGYYRQLALAAGGLVVTIYAFTLFLYRNGLGLMPTSIVAKAGIADSASGLQRILANLQISFFASRWGAVLCVGAALLLISMLFCKSKVERFLALVTLFGVGAHLAAGQYGWNNRYEVYIVAFATMMLIFLFRSLFVQFFHLCEKGKGRGRAALIAGGAAVFIFFPYVFDLFSLPVASNNIYEQQYQMHRFVTEYYKKPVAVNDLGWVVYKNDQFVLDLVGLASIKVTESRRKGIYSFALLDELTEAGGVKFAMIYQSWFPALPPTWKRIGVLQLGKRKVTPADHRVSFYSLNWDEDAVIRQKLQEFSQTLPDQVSFTFDQE